MKPGPKPKPTELKKLAGNPGKRPPNRNEPKPKKASTKPPKIVKLSANAETMWDYVVPILKRNGMWTELDPLMIVRYCQDFALWIKCKNHIDINGLGYVTYYQTVDEKGVSVDIEKGYVQYPEVAMYKALDAQLYRKESSFGMSPADRARLSIPGAEGPGEKKKHTAHDLISHRLGLVG